VVDVPEISKRSAVAGGSKNVFKASYKRKNFQKKKILPHGSRPPELWVLFCPLNRTSFKKI
jgi:hypothetical protein